MAAFDLDGTLLEHGALTREAISMLKALRKSGVTVVIATGRHRGTVPLRLKSPRLVDYLICTNGAVVTPTGGEPLFEKALSAAELKALMDLGKGFDCRYAVSAGQTTFLSKTEPLRRRKTDGGSDTKKYFWRYYMYPLHSRRIDHSWAFIVNDPHFMAEKVVCVTEKPEDDLAFRAAAEADGRFTATGSNQAAEITARGISKGSALDHLAKTLNVPKEAIVAFGNDDNDLSMKPCAGRFMAARDSSPAALAAADQVADSIPEAALRLCLGTNWKGGRT